MTLSNLLMTAYVNTASEAGKSVWDILEEVAREHLTAELYKQASGLFDPDTVIDTRKNEYQRGVTELILRFTGTEVDDIGDVATTISEGTSTAHLLTAADFVEDANGSLLYIGPLYPAMQFIKNNNEVDGPNRHILTGKWTVKLDGGNVWGTADTAEMAWRYAIGAEFGPIDEGFSPFRLK